MNAPTPCRAGGSRPSPAGDLQTVAEFVDWAWQLKALNVTGDAADLEQAFRAVVRLANRNYGGASLTPADRHLLAAIDALPAPLAGWVPPLEITEEWDE